MSEKAVFGELDHSPNAVCKDAKGGKKYMGKERRQGNRRSGIDRRTMVRFEPGKDDRRENHGRREDDKCPDFW
jgi:hypothetical protein